ncbi:MAG: hypothetical protein Kow0026_02540 [Oricola sp.]
MNPNRIFWLVVAVTLGDYLAMVLWSIPKISAAAGGLPVFDMRPVGYSFEEAAAFLAALPAEGARFYENVQHRLDAAYPALLAVTLAWSILRLAPARWGIWRHLLAVTAIPGMVFDYLENRDVARMLVLGPDGITRDLVSVASFHSRAKAVSSAAAMSILLVLLAIWAIRRWRAPHNPV